MQENENAIITAECPIAKKFSFVHLFPILNAIDKCVAIYCLKKRM